MADESSALYIVALTETRGGEFRSASYFFSDIAAASAFMVYARRVLGEAVEVHLESTRAHRQAIGALGDPSPFPELRGAPAGRARRQ